MVLWYPTHTRCYKANMPLPARSRSLVTFPPHETAKLIKEAAQKGLRLATYIRSLVMTHPDRASARAR